MADDAQVRAWAVERGIPVSAKGRVGQTVREAYSAAHNGDAAPGAQADYPPGMSEQDFTLDGADEPADGSDDGWGDTGETPPKRVRPKATSRWTFRKPSGPSRRGKSSAARKRAAPRVSTADLIGSAWRILAKMAAPMPPVYRTLRLQSVVAGPVLDDVVKGTFLDPFLQPLARMSQVSQQVAALTLPELGMGAAMIHASQCAKAGTDPNPVIMQACEEITRHGLIALVKIGGDAAARQFELEKADEEQYGPLVDMMLAYIMAEPADPHTEELAFATMAARFAGQPEPEPEQAAA